MSGLARRIRRNALRLNGPDTRGFKRARHLKAIFPAMPGESFATHARRFVRNRWQAFQAKLTREKVENVTSETDQAGTSEA